MDSQPEWYRTLFSGLFVEAQRRFPQQTQAEADFLVSALELRAGAAVLDVPCGTGRLTLELAERGYAATGVDLTQELLEDGRQAAAGRDLPVRFEQRDMRDLPWAGTFDGAFCAGNSFSYLGEEGDRNFLKAVWTSLKPGGRFAVMTGSCAEGFFQQRLQRAWFPLGDLLFLLDTSYDPATARCTSSYTLIQGEKTERHQAIYRIYTYLELLQLFQEAGFSDVQTFGSLNREPFGLGSPCLWILAVRNAECGVRS